MKILFVLEHFHPYIGGVEYLFKQLTQELCKQGHQVKVITTKFDKKLAIFETIDQVEIHRVNCKNRFAFSFKSIPTIFKNASNYDIIHTSTYNAAFPAWIVSILKRKKCILTFHEYWGKLWMKLPYLTFYQRILYRLFETIVAKLNYEKIIAVSDYTKQSLIDAGIKKNNIIRIYNGLNYDSINKFKEKNSKYTRSDFGFTRHCFNMIFVGRLGVSKGFNILLPAIDSFLTKNKNARLTLVLPTAPKAMYYRLIKLINNLKSNDRITLKHHLTKDELFEEIIKSDCILVPSYSEGFCFVAAEACALGVPVISSQKGALKEVVSGKYIHIDPLSVEGLETAINKAYNNTWSQKKSTQFLLKDSINQHIKLYEKILNG